MPTQRKAQFWFSKYLQRRIRKRRRRWSRRTSWTATLSVCITSMQKCFHIVLNEFQYVMCVYLIFLASLRLASFYWCIFEVCVYTMKGFFLVHIHKYMHKHTHTHKQKVKHFANLTEHMALRLNHSPIS